MAGGADRFSVWNADNQCFSFGKFGFGDFCQVGHLNAIQFTRDAGLIVEKVHNISTETIFEALAFIEIKGAHLVNLNVLLFTENGAQETLEIQRASTDLRHGEGNYVVGHAFQFGRKY